MKIKTLKELKTKIDAFETLYEYEPRVYVSGYIVFQSGKKLDANDWRISLSSVKYHCSSDTDYFLGVYVGESDTVIEYVRPENCVYSIFQK